MNYLDFQTPAKIFRAEKKIQKVDGSAETWESTVGAYIKKGTPGAPYCIPNEMICSAVGSFLGLPVPPGGIVIIPSEPDIYWFASLDFNLERRTLTTISPQTFLKEQLQLGTGIFLFDVLVGNDDRVDRNFKADLEITPTQFYVFDHSHALFATGNDAGATHLEKKWDELATDAHHLLGSITDTSYFGHWISRIRQIPDFFIEDTVSNAARFVLTDTEAIKVTQFLKHRRDKIGDILNRNRNRFVGVKSWTPF